MSVDRQPHGRPITDDPRNLIPPMWERFPVPTCTDDVINLGQANIRGLIRAWRKESDELKARIRNLKDDMLPPGSREVIADCRITIIESAARIHRLRRLLQEARQRPETAEIPVFTCLRPAGSFKIHDRVVCFQPANNIWYDCEVVSRFSAPLRHATWHCVAVCPGDEWRGTHGVPPLMDFDTPGWWYFSHDPRILKPEEQAYLVQNPTYADCWVDQASVWYGNHEYPTPGNLADLRDSLRTSSTTTEP